MHVVKVTDLDRFMKRTGLHFYVYTDLYEENNDIKCVTTTRSYYLGRSHHVISAVESATTPAAAVTCMVADICTWILFWYRDESVITGHMFRRRRLVDWLKWLVKSVGRLVIIWATDCESFPQIELSVYSDWHFWWLASVCPPVCLSVRPFICHQQYLEAKQQRLWIF